MSKGLIRERLSLRESRQLEKRRKKGEKQHSNKKDERGERRGEGLLDQCRIPPPLSPTPIHSFDTIPLVQLIFSEEKRDERNTREMNRR